MSQRIESRALPPVEVFNNLAVDIDNLGVITRPRRTATFSLPANVFTVVSWQDNDNDTRGDMWDPAEPTKLSIRVGGTYLFQLQVRFPVSGGSASGYRWCYLLRAGAVSSFVVSHDTQGGSTAFEGATAVTRAVLSCVPGDVIYGAAQSTVAVTCGAADYGGTYLMASRIGSSGSTGAMAATAGVGTNPIGPEAIETVRDPRVAAAISRKAAR